MWQMLPFDGLPMSPEAVLRANRMAAAVPKSVYCHPSRLEGVDREILHIDLEVR